MNKNTYKKYLNSEHWRSLRTERLVMAKYNCEICPSKAKEVHHINYRNLYDVKIHDVVAVCQECHGKIHQAIKLNLIRPSGQSSYGDTTNGLKKYLELEKSGEFTSKVTAIPSKKICNKLNKLSEINKKTIENMFSVKLPNDFMEWENKSIDDRLFSKLNQLANIQIPKKAQPIKESSKTCLRRKVKELNLQTVSLRKTMNYDNNPIRKELIEKLIKENEDLVKKMRLIIKNS